MFRLQVLLACMLVLFCTSTALLVWNNSITKRKIIERQKVKVIRNVAYDGAVSIPREYGMVFGTHGNGVERPSTCKPLNKNGCDRVGESSVCILYALNGYGILININMLCRGNINKKWFFTIMVGLLKIHHKRQVNRYDQHRLPRVHWYNNKSKIKNAQLITMIRESSFALNKIISATVNRNTKEEENMITFRIAERKIGRAHV